MNVDKTRRNGRRSPEQALPRISIALLISLISFVVWIAQVAVSDSGPIWDTNLGRYMILKSHQFDPRSILTHHFLHENSIHLFANLACLLFAGRVLEPRWGTLRFSGFILLSTLACGFSIYLVGFFHGALVESPGENITFGASGLALACLTAYILTVEDRPLLGILTERYLIWSGILAGATLLVFYQNSYPARPLEPSVLLTPQLSGIATGTLLGLGFLSWERFLERRPSRRMSGAELDLVPDIQTRVDQLLDKISREGIESLSPEEEAFLRSASRHYRNPNS